ncbi:hypothetical protein ACQP2T_53575 [Nonomuraea sp. CA-143628]|uniref:hypothetical protein n=1 Tax=Nonomuraea sp. CA-143628 TaxID=3239997 RepID=UPI003D928088
MARFNNVGYSVKMVIMGVSGNNCKDVGCRVSADPAQVLQGSDLARALVTTGIDNDPATSAQVHNDGLAPAGSEY